MNKSDNTVSESTRNQRALDELHKSKDYEKDRGRVLHGPGGEEVVDNQMAAMLNGVHTYNRDGFQGRSLDTGARPKVLPDDGSVGAELMRTSTAVGAQGKAIDQAPDTPFVEDAEEPVIAEDLEDPALADARAAAIRQQQDKAAKFAKPEEESKEPRKANIELKKG